MLIVNYLFFLIFNYPLYKKGVGGKNSTIPILSGVTTSLLLEFYKLIMDSLKIASCLGLFRKHAFHIFLSVYLILGVVFHIYYNNKRLMKIQAKFIRLNRNSKLNHLILIVLYIVTILCFLDVV